MNAADLLNNLKHLANKCSLTDSPIVAVREDGLPYSIKAVVAEHHVDGDGSTTVWLKIEEV